MNVQTGIALLLALASTVLTNIAYLREHGLTVIGGPTAVSAIGIARSRSQGTAASSGVAQCHIQTGYSRSTASLRRHACAAAAYSNR